MGKEGSTGRRRLVQLYRDELASICFSHRRIRRGLRQACGGFFSSTQPSLRGVEEMKAQIKIKG